MSGLFDCAMNLGGAKRIAETNPTIFSHASLVKGDAILHIKPEAKIKDAKEAVREYYDDSKPKITIFNNQLMVLDGIMR